MLQPSKKKHTTLNRPHREEAFDITAGLRNRTKKLGIRNRYLKPDFSARLRSLAVIALHMVKVSKGSSHKAYSAQCVFVERLKHARDTRQKPFYIQISIEIKIKSARFVLNVFA